MENIFFFRNEILGNTKEVETTYSHYKQARNIAWQFLIDNNVNKLPIDLASIAKNNDWEILEYKNDEETINHIFGSIDYKAVEAVSCVQNKHFYIAYKDSKNYGRNRFTIAHEFGHYVLLHFANYYTPIDFEKQANQFASRILMPACVLKECDALCAEQISALCGVSMQAATFRENRMQELLQRDKFYLSNYEKIVLKQFESFIQNYKRSD